MQSISGSITGSHPLHEDRPRLRLLSSIDGGLILSALCMAGTRTLKDAHLKTTVIA